MNFQVILPGIRVSLASPRFASGGTLFQYLRSHGGPLGLLFAFGAGLAAPAAWQCV